MIDARGFLSSLSVGASGSKLRLGQAQVRSVDSDPVYTLTSGEAVIVPASAEWGQSECIAPYLGEYPPRPGGSCWYVTDGVERIILGMVAPDGPPTAGLSLNAIVPSVPLSGSALVANMSVIDNDPWNTFSVTQYDGSTAGCLVVPADGVYNVHAYGVWAANSTGYRQVAIRKGGSVLEFSRTPATTAGAYYQSLTIPAAVLTKGEYISALFTQTSTGSLQLNDGSLTLNYVGRRRKQVLVSGTDISIDGNFGYASINQSAVSKWFTSVTSATATLDVSPNTYSTNVNALKIAYTNGGTQQAFQSVNYPVVPGQVWTMSGFIKSSVNISGSGTDYFKAELKGAGSSPIVEVATFGTAFTTYLSAVSASAYNSFSISGTVPADCYVMRPNLSLIRPAGSAGTFWVGQISLVEIIR